MNDNESCLVLQYKDKICVQPLAPENAAIQVLEAHSAQINQVQVQVQGYANNAAYFVSRLETGDALCSLTWSDAKIKVEDVVSAAGYHITALEADGADLYFLDDKGRKHKVRNPAGEAVHTIHELH